MSYEERKYRTLINPERFSYFSSLYKETDLLIGCSYTAHIGELQKCSLHQIRQLRTELDSFIKMHPEFASSYTPLSYKQKQAEAIEDLLEAGRIAGTGPMAGVAGLFAKNIGLTLKSKFKLEEIIVENGGDIYANIKQKLTVSVYAGNSPLSNKIHLRIGAGEWGICTSSGTVGHSKSFGKADALAVISASPLIADTLATGLANKVQGEDDIERVLELSSDYKEVLGIMIIVGDKVGVKGDLELC